MKLSDLFENGDAEFDAAKEMWNDWEDLENSENYVFYDVEELAQAVSKHRNNFSHQQLDVLDKLVQKMINTFSDNNVRLSASKLPSSVKYIHSSDFAKLDTIRCFDFLEKYVNDICNAAITFDEYRELKKNDVADSIRDSSEDEYSRNGVRRSDF